ncbi:hypothetical protein, partial [Algivirga pacifica]|uniref:hypothetical protein n=1 Tax=Algivirga pacifica TaxID=1162670 RepID=UPI0031E909C8
GMPFFENQIFEKTLGIRGLKQFGATVPTFFIIWANINTLDILLIKYGVFNLHFGEYLLIYAGIIFLYIHFGISIRKNFVKKYKGKKSNIGGFLVILYLASSIALFLYLGNQNRVEIAKEKVLKTFENIPDHFKYIKIDTVDEKGRRQIIYKRVPINSLTEDSVQ